MAEKKKKSNMGGAREGAGRKPKSADGSHRIGFRCSSETWAILQQVENKTEFIEKAIKEKWRRVTPYTMV